LLTPATKNLAMLLFLNPQRLKSVDVISEECVGHAIGHARHLDLSGNTIWGLVHTRGKKCSEERHVIEKSWYHLCDSVPVASGNFPESKKSRNGGFPDTNLALYML